jgi:hypothetical protein
VGNSPKVAKIKFAVTAVNVAVIGTVAVVRFVGHLRTIPGQAGLLHPEKSESDPLAVSAVKVTCGVEKEAEQVPGQLIPGCSTDVTVPVPTIETVT